MLIVADENMPLVREVFAPLGEVRTLAGRNLSPEAVRAADILLVRSVTRVDRALLDGSRVRFVGTATIGTDHLDLDYLQARDIAVASAPGSNADAVVDYVVSALCALEGVLENLLTGARVGIIGLGNVGSRVSRRLQGLGVDCMGYDPLLSAATNLPCVDFDTVLNADVLCCHAPLTQGVSFPTYHMLDARQLQRLRAGAVLLNAGRGGVVDNVALKQALAERGDLRAVLDVWENEPLIDGELLRRVALATPHIAGYSADGKIVGTRMMLEACCNFLGIAAPIAGITEMPAPRIQLPEGGVGADLIRAAVQTVYAVKADDRRMRAVLQNLRGSALGNAFDMLRKNYPERREFSTYAIDNWKNFSADQQALLLGVGFTAPA